MVRFIFGFIIPVASTYLKMKKKMGQMQDFHNSSSQNHQQKTQSQFSAKPDKVSKSDYIDFEEIK
jgi:hypothetical protein